MFPSMHLWSLGFSMRCQSAKDDCSLERSSLLLRPDLHTDSGFELPVPGFANGFEQRPFPGQRGVRVHLEAVLLEVSRGDL
ncbi:hypothetical protein SKAU_G00025140 [Synaphobranchus kaupii]|uniref:Uncharacterized protein n=1 Tax=Synaphobranchus kaupii TaxID=118154 RepID=A0A9Q1GCJ3_SYNKA|nr:hypothetical protein SKAU_G00025140 [Synaphobranchus kaupii]